MRMLTTLDYGLDLELAVGVCPIVPYASDLPSLLHYAVLYALLRALMPSEHAAHACADDGDASVVHSSHCLE